MWPFVGGTGWRFLARIGSSWAPAMRRALITAVGRQVWRCTRYESSYRCVARGGAANASAQMAEEPLDSFRQMTDAHWQRLLASDSSVTSRQPEQVAGAAAGAAAGARDKGRLLWSRLIPRAACLCLLLWNAHLVVEDGFG